MIPGHSSVPETRDPHLADGQRQSIRPTPHRHRIAKNGATAVAAFVHPHAALRVSTSRRSDLRRSRTPRRSPTRAIDVPRRERLHPSRPATDAPRTRWRTRYPQSHGRRVHAFTIVAHFCTCKLRMETRLGKRGDARSTPADALPYPAARCCFSSRNTPTSSGLKPAWGARGDRSMNDWVSAPPR